MREVYPITARMVRRADGTNDTIRSAQQRPTPHHPFSTAPELDHPIGVELCPRTGVAVTLFAAGGRSYDTTARGGNTGTETVLVSAGDDKNFFSRCAVTPLAHCVRRVNPYTETSHYR